MNSEEQRDQMETSKRNYITSKGRIIKYRVLPI